MPRGAMCFRATMHCCGLLLLAEPMRRMQVRSLILQCGLVFRVCYLSVLLACGFVFNIIQLIREGVCTHVEGCFRAGWAV